MITFQPGVRFIAGTGFTTQLLNLSGSSAPLAKRLQINAPSIDMSLGLYTGHQPSALSLSGFREAYVYEPDLYGGASRSGVDLGGGNFRGGDSGIEPLNITYFEVRGGRIKGFLDNGVYCGGTNTAGPTDDGFEYKAVGTHFENNVTGFMGKRSGFMMRSIDCTYIGNGLGICTAEVPTPQDPGTVYRLEAEGNYFTKNSNCAEFRGQTKGYFHDNICEDWGYLEDNVTIRTNPVNRYALRMNGARNGSVSDNVFRMVDLATSSHKNLRVNNYTDINGTVFTGGAITGEDNKTVNVVEPFYAEAGVSQSIIGFTQMGGISPTFNNVDGNTFIRSRAIGNTDDIIRVGSSAAGVIGACAAYTAALERFSFTSQAVLFPSLTAALASTTYTATFAVPGLLAGDQVVITPASSGAVNGGISLSYRSEAGQIGLSVRNLTAGTLNLSTLAYNITAWRR